MIERIELIDLQDSMESVTSVRDTVRIERLDTDPGRLAERPAERPVEVTAEHGFEGFGEGLVMDERLVVSPCEGALRDRRAKKGDYVCAGEVVAKVVGPDGQSVAVHSPFAGWVMGFLLPHGSPVRRREPVLWLRSQ
ncbi:MAG: hypothetical protein NVSMB32_02590 [Actinomycetota bacterium]